MDLVWNVQNGELYWNSGHKVGKEMLNTLIGAFGSKETVLAKVSAQSRIQTSKIKRINSIANSVGRYFEYCFYEAAIKKVQEVLGKPDSWAQERINSADSSFLEQENLGLFLRDKTVIEQRAKEAAEKIISDFNKDQLDNLLIQAIAGSSTKGDVQIGDIIFELKWYQNPSSIKWFTLSDVKHFPETFRQYLRGLREQHLDTEITPGEQILPEETWVNNIRTIGFSKYVNEVLKGGSDDITFFSYLLQKANADKDLNLSNKKIIISNGGSLEHPVITLDLQALLNNVGSIKGEWPNNSDKYLFYQMIGQEKISDLGYLTTDPTVIYDASYDKRKITHTKRQDEIKQWTSTSFLFYLQKGFYMP